MRRLITYLTLFCFVAVHTPGFGGPHDEGVAAGNTANEAARPKVNSTEASTNVPGYTTTPPQTSLYGKPNLSGDANALITSCPGGPSDPTCQAVTGAATSANTPRPYVGPHDPSVAGARAIVSNPSTVLGSLSPYYAGCTTAEVTPGAGNKPRTCYRYIGVGNFSCARKLTVSIDLAPNCKPGEWFASTASGSTGLDVQCIPNRKADAQHFRLTSSGNPLAYFNVDMTSNVIFPIPVATISTSSGMDGTPLRTMVWVVGNLCSGDSCSLTAMVAAERMESSCTGDWQSGFSCTYQYPFVSQYAACPAGTQSGDNIVHQTCDINQGCTTSTLDGTKCYSPAAGWTGLVGYDITGTIPGSFWSFQSDRSVTGWTPNPLFGPIPTMTLAYVKPKTTITENDQWDDECPILASGGRCTQQTAPLCVDGPSSKIVDGTSVTRPCWSYETTFACSSGPPLDECAPLAASGCSAASSTCRQVNATTGTCQVYEDTYNCPVAGEPFTTASNCPSNVFCLGASCFNIASVNDPDFARSVSMIEGAREAGIYLDTDRMRLFIGAPSGCSLRYDPLGIMLNANCCKPDSSYSGYSNQSLFNGSTYMYDSLFTMENAQFIYQAVGAMVAGGEVSGSFSAFGVTYTAGAEAVAAVEASYAAGETAGVLYVAESGTWAVSFDPWSLVIMIIILLIIEEITCDAPEEIHNLREGAGLCHQVGAYCVRYHFFPHQRQCRKLNRSFCCFNSMLSRIINQQGRPQIGKAWGDVRSPDCSGFTVAELQRLDFGAMDFSEFYASIIPKLPDTNAIVTGAKTGAASCYYGQGRCK